MRRRVDPDNRVEPAVIDPRRPVRSDNHAVRRRSTPERDLFDLAGLGVEATEHALPLRSIPDSAVGRRRHIVRAAAGGREIGPADIRDCGCREDEQRH